MNKSQTGKIFTFTFLREVKSKGYIGLTLGVAAFALALITVIFLIIGHTGGESGESSESVSAPMPDKLVVVDENTDRWQTVSGFLGIPVELAADAVSAGEQAGERSLVIAVEEGVCRTLLPEETDLTYGSADMVSMLLSNILPAASSKEPEAAMAALNSTVNIVYDVPTEDEEAETESPEEAMRKSVGGVLAYFVIFIMYFIILAYGQNTAASLVMEKSSKLMDTFLVYAKPVSMVMGKVLAMVCAAIIQLLVWAAAIFGGFMIGSAVGGKGVKVRAFFDLLGELFTPGTVALALAIALAGIVMYCAVSAFGGSLASKTEDLGSTNSIFSLLLVASFLIAMFTGTFIGSGTTPTWAYYVPFISVLVAPGAVLMGTITVGQGLISLLITAVFAYIIMYAAARAYVMMAFYRGKVPSPVKVIKMLVPGKGR